MNCVVCGVKTGDWPTHDFDTCSKHACRREVQERERLREEQASGLSPDKKCPQCGVMFVSRACKRGKPKTYCSRRCSEKHSQNSRCHELTCQQCGREYISVCEVLPQKHFCSSDCRNTRVCTVCGDAFVVKVIPSRRGIGHARITCSPECLSVRRQQIASERPDYLGIADGDVNFYKRRRNKWKRENGNYEKVDLQVVLKRDNFRCQIPGCLFPGVPIHPTANPPHPLAGTRQHVINLCHGGEHNYGNIVAGHFICNSTESKFDLRTRGKKKKTVA